MPRILKIIFYGGVFFASFLIFLYWMFPMSVVKHRLIAAVDRSLGPDYDLAIEEISTYRLTGAKLQGVELKKTIDGKKTDIWTAEKMTVRATIFSLIFGSPKIQFDARSSKARIYGSMVHKEGVWNVEGSFEDVDVGMTPFLQLKSGLKFSSSIDGKIELHINPAQPLRTTGDIELAFNKLLLKKGDLSLGEMGSLSLPDILLASEKSVLNAKIDKGSIQMEPLRLKGKAFLIDLTGRIFLAQSMDKFRMNLSGKFQLPVELWNLLEKNLPDKFLSDLKRQKSSDETYPLSVSGQMSTPQIYSGSVKLYPKNISELF